MKILQKLGVLGIAITLFIMSFLLVSKVHGAPTGNIVRNLFAETGSLYSIGELTKTFLNGFFDNVYVTQLTGEDCVGTDSDGKLVSGTCTGGTGGSSDGDAGAIQYSDGAGGFVASSTAFVWDDAVGQLQVGGESPIYTGNPNEPLLVVSNIDDYSAIAIQNLSPDGVSSFIAYGDDDDGEIDTGKYIEMSFTGSNWDGGDLVGASAAAIGVNSANLVISTFSPDKHIDFTTGGDLFENRRVRIQDDRTTFFANYEADIANDVASTTLWTTGDGWSVSGGLVKAVSTEDYSSIYPSASTTIAIGTKYKVTITATTTTGIPTYTLGGVAGGNITDGTRVDYIEALTDADFIVTAASTTATVIEALEILPLVDATGDAFVEGDLKVGGSITTNNDDTIFNIDGEGIVTFPLFPFLPAEYPTQDNQAANKAYVDNVAANQRFVTEVRAATTSTLPAVTYANGSSGVGATLTADANGALPAIDGVTLLVGEMILVKDQVNEAHNGVYEVTSLGDGSNPFVLTRITTYDTQAEITIGTYFTILEGDENVLKQFIMNNNATITVGTTDITFGQLSAQIQYTSGNNGISIIGTVISLVLSATNSGLEIVGDGLRVLVDNTTIERTSGGLAIKAGAIDLASSLISGILGVANGGTGISTTPNNGELLIGNGTGYTQTTLTAGDNITITNGAGSIEIDATGGGGANATSSFGATIMTYPVVAAAQTNQAMTNAPPGEQEIFSTATASSTNARIKADLTRAEAFRFNARQVTAGATGATAKVQCSLDGTTWTDLTGSVSTMDIGVLGTQPEVTPWASVNSGCKSDVFLRILTNGGNSTNDPTWREINYQFRLTQPTVGQQATSTITVAVAATPNTAQGWTNQPAATTEIFGATNARFKYDTIGATQYRIVVNQAIVGAAGADLNLQCSSDNTTFVAADTGGVGEVDISSLGLKVGAWASLSPSCEGSDLFWRLVGKTDGVSTGDPSFRQIHVQFDTTEQVLGSSGGGSNWVYDTNFGVDVLTPSSTVPVWFKAPIYASSSLTVQGSNFATTTIGSNTDYIRFEQGNFGGLVGALPMMRGNLDLNVATNAQGIASWSGFAAVEDGTLGDDVPYISFASADVGTTLNSFAFEYATTSRTLFARGTSTANFVFDDSDAGNPMKVGISTSSPSHALSVEGIGYFVDNVSSTTAPASLKIASREFLGLVNGMILEGIASNGNQGLGTVREFTILGGSSFNPQLIFNSEDIAQNANIGYATTTDIMSFNNALGGYTFNTEGNNNTSLRVDMRDFSGSLLTDLKVPTLYGNTVSSIIGELNTVGINNNLLIGEQSSLNSFPSISFGAADFGDTGNSANITYTTTTAQFNLDKQLVIQDTNNDPRITFSTDDASTSSEMYLNNEDSFFFTGASGGYFHDAAIAVVNDDQSNVVLASANGVNLSAISYSSSTDVMSFIQASGGYEFDNLAPVGADPLCWDGSGGSLIGDCSSLAKYKTNQKSFASGLADVLKLDPKTFDWKRKADGSLSDTDQYDHVNQDTGFIAEEVALVNPNFGRYNEDGELQDVNERGIMGALINAIKEMFSWLQMQHSWNADQDSEIELIKTEVCAKDNTYSFCK